TAGEEEPWIGPAPRVTLGSEDGIPPGAAGRKEVHAELIDRGDLLPVDVGGVRGTRFVPGAEEERLDQAEREVAAGEPPGGRRAADAILAAHAPLVCDRDLLRTLYGSDYLRAGKAPPRGIRLAEVEDGRHPVAGVAAVVDGRHSDLVAVAEVHREISGPGDGRRPGRRPGAAVDAALDGEGVEPGSEDLEAD